MPPRMTSPRALLCSPEVERQRKQHRMRKSLMAKLEHIKLARAPDEHDEHSYDEELESYTITKHRQPVDPDMQVRP